MVEFIGHFELKRFVAGCCAAAVIVLWHLPAAHGQEAEKGERVVTSRFCIINRPGVNASFSGSKAVTPTVSAPLSAIRSGRIKSFFSGKMEKIGFGAPPCFTIDSEQVSNVDPLTATTHTDEIAVREKTIAARGESEFFPTFGYFGRFSQKGNKALAVGVGLKNSAAEIWGDDDSTPQARVALMFGVGF